MKWKAKVTLNFFDGIKADAVMFIWRYNELERKQPPNIPEVNYAG
jgi:hypothetical protein